MPATNTLSPDEQKTLAWEFALKSAANDSEGVKAMSTDDFTCEAMEVDGDFEVDGVMVPAKMSREQYLKYGVPAMQLLFVDGIRFKKELAISDGPHVVILARSDALARNGKKYNNVYAWYFKFEGDKISMLKEYRDTHHSRKVIWE